jgi:hypothetical protein
MHGKVALPIARVVVNGISRPELGTEDIFLQKQDNVECVVSCLSSGVGVCQANSPSSNTVLECIDNGDIPIGKLSPNPEISQETFSRCWDVCKEM